MEEKKQIQGPLTYELSKFNKWLIDMTPIIVEMHGKDIINNAVWNVGHISAYSKEEIKSCSESILKNYNEHPHYLDFYDGSLTIEFKNGVKMIMEGDDRTLGGVFIIGVK